MHYQAFKTEFIAPLPLESVLWRIADSDIAAFLRRRNASFGSGS